MMYKIKEWNCAYDDHFREYYSPGWIYVFTTRWYLIAALRCLYLNLTTSLKHEVEIYANTTI